MFAWPAQLFGSDPLPRAGLSLGEFIGYRVWELHLRGGRQVLRSWIHDCHWPAGGYVSDVSCDVLGYGPTDGIADHNDRGVWAFKTEDRLAASFATISCVRALIFGTCWMWGTVIEHSRGYRAQYASVRSLDGVIGGTDGLIPNLDALRSDYGVTENDRRV